MLLLNGINYEVFADMMKKFKTLHIWFIIQFETLQLIE